MWNAIFISFSYPFVWADPLTDIMIDIDVDLLPDVMLGVGIGMLPKTVTDVLVPFEFPLPAS